MATEKLKFTQSNYLWSPQSEADIMVPLCKICFQTSEYNIQQSSRTEYISSLQLLNHTRNSINQLGFEIINTPLSGVCAWEAVALNISKNIPNSIQQFECYSINGVAELVKLYRLDKQTSVTDVQSTNIGRVLTTCKLLFLKILLVSNLFIVIARKFWVSALDKSTVIELQKEILTSVYPTLKKFAQQSEEHSDLGDIKDLNKTDFKTMKLEFNRKVWKQICTANQTIWHEGEVSYYFISFFSSYVLNYPVFIWTVSRETGDLLLTEVIATGNMEHRPVLNLFNPIIHIQQTGEGNQSHYQALKRTFSLDLKHFQEFIDVAKYNIIY